MMQELARKAQEHKEFLEKLNDPNYYKQVFMGDNEQYKFYLKPLDERKRKAPRGRMENGMMMSV